MTLTNISNALPETSEHSEDERVPIDASYGLENGRTGRDAETETMIFLTSKEGDSFQIPYSIAKLSKVLLELKQDHNPTEDESIIPMVIEMSSGALTKVIEYCTHYSKEPMTPISIPLESSKIEEIVQDWYSNYIKNMEWKLLLQLVGAANFLDIKPMLQLCCLGVVSRIVGRSANEVRPMFGISNPVDGVWNPEQREEVERENVWALEARRGFIAETTRAASPGITSNSNDMSNDDMNHDVP